MERLSLEQYLTQVIWPAFLTTMTVMAWTVLILSLRDDSRPKGRL